MRRPARSYRYISIFLGIFLLAAAAVVASVALLDRYQQEVVARVEDATDKDVSIGEVRVSFYGGVGFKLSDIAICEPGSGEALVRADFLFVGLDLWSLVRAAIKIDRVYLYRPFLHVKRMRPHADGEDATWEIGGVIKIPGQAPEGEPEAGSAEAEEGAGDAGSTQDRVEDLLALLPWEDTVTIKEGEVRLVDMGKKNRAFELRELDLHLGRGRIGRGVKAFLSTEIDQEGEPARLRVEGHLGGLFKEKIPGARPVELRVKVSDLSLESLWTWLISPPDKGLAHDREETGPEVAGETVGRKALAARTLRRSRLSGLARVDIELAGRELDDLELSAGVSVASFRADFSDLFDGPFEADEANLTGKARLRGERLDIETLALDLAPVVLRVAGEASGVGQGKVDLRLEADTPWMPLVEVKRYIPTKLINTRTWYFLTAMTEGGRGRLSSLRYEGPLKELARLKAQENWGRLRAVMEFEEGDVLLPLDEPYLPIKGVKGTIVMDQGQLEFLDGAGTYGGSVIEHLSGSMTNIHGKEKILRMTILAKPELSEIPLELQHSFLPPGVVDLARGIERAGGPSTLALELVATIKDEGKGVECDWCLECRGIKLRHALRAGAFTDIHGSLCFEEDAFSTHRLDARYRGDSITLKGGAAGLFRGAQPQVNLEASTLGFGLQNAIELLQMEDAACATGRLSGNLAAQVDLVRAARPQITLRGGLDLESGSLELHGLPLRPVEELNGAFRFEEGRFICDHLEGRVAGDRVEITGSVDYGDETDVTFSLRSPRLSLASLIREEEPAVPASDKEESPAEQAGDEGGIKGRSPLMKTRVDGDVEIASGRLGLPFQDLTASVGMGKGVLRIQDIHAGLLGGDFEGGGWINLLAPDGKRLGIHLAASGVDLAAVMRALEAQEELFTGRASLEGALEGTLGLPEGFWRTTEGRATLKVGEGVLRKYAILCKTLTLIDATKWLDLKPSEIMARGLPYRGITGTFKINDGVAYTEDLLIDSRVMMVSAVGAIDLMEKKVDLLVGMSPLGNVDSAIDMIPILGHVITGENRSIIIFYFKMEGPMGDPKVRLVPFKTLDKGVLGIFRRLFNLPQDLIEGGRRSR